MSDAFIRSSISIICFYSVHIYANVSVILLNITIMIIGDIILILMCSSVVFILIRLRILNRLSRISFGCAFTAMRIISMLSVLLSIIIANALMIVMHALFAFAIEVMLLMVVTHII